MAADRRQGLRDRLVQEAERQIAATGLPELRARSLAEAAGCSVGAIYTAFPDLDALILAVNGRTLAAIDAVMAPADPPGAPLEALLRLAEAYLDFAATERHRWQALFIHRLPEGVAAPDWYAELRARAFSHVEAPLAGLLPGQSAAERGLLARSMFAAVHGVVALGLDEKVAAMTQAQLREQLRLVVAAMTRGLATT